MTGMKYKRKSQRLPHQVLRMFLEQRGSARRLYHAFMGRSDGVNKDGIYRTIDQRILGDERFAEEVKHKYNLRLSTTKRPKDYALGEIAQGVERTCAIKLAAMREKGKGADVRMGRRLFSLMAKEYGHQGKEVAEYLKRDPAAITRYLKETEDLGGPKTSAG